MAEVTKTEYDRERAAFQAKKEGLLRDLKQAQADKVETEKKASDFKAKVQKEIQVYKRLKYEQGYKDRAQGKVPRHPLEVNVSRGDQSASGSLIYDAPLSTIDSGLTIEAPQDPPAGATIVAPLVEPIFGATGASP